MRHADLRHYALSEERSKLLCRQPRVAHDSAHGEGVDRVMSRNGENALAIGHDRVLSFPHDSEACLLQCPDRAKVNGDAEAERARLQKEIARGEGMLANAKFVDNAPLQVVEAEREKLARYQRELDALPS